MESIFLKTFLPISLVIIMFGMGMGLTLDDFKRIVQKPTAVAVGLFSQMIGLPVLAFAVATLFDLKPELAFGLMLLAFCPGGVTSNVFTYLARADIGLSITLTGITGLLSPFTVTVFGSWAYGYFFGEATEIPFPIGNTIGLLVGIIIVPTAAGMVLRWWKPELTEKTERPFRLFSLLALIVAVAGIVYDTRHNFVEYLVLGGPSTITLNIVAMLLGFATAWVAKLEPDQAVTISLEVGMQNTMTAMLIAVTLLEQPALAVTPAAYGFLMFFTAGLIVLIGVRLFKHDLKTGPTT